MNVTEVRELIDDLERIEGKFKSLTLIIDGKRMVYEKLECISGNTGMTTAMLSFKGECEHKIVFEMHKLSYWRLMR